MRFLSLFIAAAPLLATASAFAAETSPNFESSLELDKRTLGLLPNLFCCGGLLGLPLHKRTICLAKRTIFGPQCCPDKCAKPSNGYGICNGSKCDFACNGGFIKSGSKCVSACSANNCPTPSNGYAFCTNNACDSGCNSGYSKKNGQCVSNTPIGTVDNCARIGDKCAGTSNGYPTCSNGSCGLSCNNGFYLSNGVCVPNTPTGTVDNCARIGDKCPTTSNGYPTCFNGSCGLGCNGNFYLSNGSCVPNTPTGTVDNCARIGDKCPTTANGTPVCSASQCSIKCNTGFGLTNFGTCVDITSDPTHCGNVNLSCPVVANSYATCSNGVCGLQCQSGFTLSNGACVQNPSTGTVDNCARIGDKCASTSNGYPICSSGVCSVGCNGGFTLSNGACIPTVNPPTNPNLPNPSSCPAGTARKQFSVYVDHQTTMDGLPATYAADFAACASQCDALSNCASFDFWDGHQCGIQTGGTGFDGFQKLDGVFHAVPGPCSSTTSRCPEEGRQYCFDFAECVPVASAPTKKPFALYNGFQSTADGLDAVDAGSKAECASLCAANSECKSFDFWYEGSQGKCGIQVSGDPFKGFQPLAGVVHGVAGKCSDLSCPIVDANCEDLSVSPASRFRHRRRLNRHA